MVVGGEDGGGGGDEGGGGGGGSGAFAGADVDLPCLFVVVVVVFIVVDIFEMAVKSFSVDRATGLAADCPPLAGAAFEERLDFRFAPNGAEFLLTGGDRLMLLLPLLMLMLLLLLLPFSVSFFLSRRRSCQLLVLREF